jgi:hypothetical protein
MKRICIMSTVLYPPSDADTAQVHGTPELEKLGGPLDASSSSPARGRPVDHFVDTVVAHGPLQVEKLEGR